MAYGFGLAIDDSRYSSLTVGFVDSYSNHVIATLRETKQVLTG
jgi:hypothetical protein